MEVEFIHDDKAYTIQIIEMPTIPRKGETITFLPYDDGQEYKVTHIDYRIKDRKLECVYIWVK